MVPLEKCGRTVLEIVWPTDHSETIRNGVTLIARLLQYVPCLYVLILKIAGNDVSKHSLKRSQKVKNVPTKTSVELSSKGETAFIYDLLFQCLVVLSNGCNIDCKALTTVKDIDS